MEKKTGNVFRYVRKNSKVISVLFSGIIAVIWLSALYHSDAVYGDAAGYNIMADKFLKEGLFNFHFQLEDEMTTFLFSVRGYAWPLVIAILKFLGMEKRIGWIVLWGVFAAITLSYIVPELFGRVFGRKMGLLERIIPLVCTIIFWPGVLLYPLSDLPAVAFAFCGILLIMSCNKKKLIHQCILLMLAGFLLQFSYYIRTGCISSLIIGVLCYLIYIRQEKHIYKFIGIICLIIGVYFATIPQIIINSEYNGRASWEVPISFTTGIVDEEWYSGISTFRYETNVSDRYPEAAMKTHDDLAEILLENDNINPKEVGMRQVLFEILKHPFEYLGIYISKLVNYIDPRFGEIYLKKLAPFNYLIIFINYIIWFLFGVSIIFMLGKQNELAAVKVRNVEISNLVCFFKYRFLWILACISPALIHVAGTHVEPRYIYPVYLLTWTSTAMAFLTKDFWDYIKNRIVSLLILFLLTFGACWSIWNFTFVEFPYAGVFYQKQPELYEKDEMTETSDICVENDITVAIHEYEYSDNKLTIWAYGFINDENSKDTVITLSLMNNSVEYRYNIKSSDREDVANVFENKDYLRSGIYFSQYLFGLKPGEYDVVLMLENGGKKHIFDTGENIVIS